MLMLATELLVGQLAAHSMPPRFGMSVAESTVLRRINVITSRPRWQRTLTGPVSFSMESITT